MVNTNKINNAKQQAKGKLKEVAGRATGDAGLRDEGKDDQSMAKLKQAGEKIKDALKN